MSIFEALMLLCFGAAWPLSIYRSYTSRTTGGKSLPFLLVIILGYVAGIINKLLYNYDFVLYLYILNMAMVSVDALLWIRNRRIELKAKEETEQ
ncbi:hypothetical protein [Chakrabartyella piscis]|uniref:hypothetical protein n=1 Tax=Chakrabartyella piscis TaxID=2918914 RepID=UPI002958CA0F|nr:hypothetical protein [Chakrabartyella piscis]